MVKCKKTTSENNNFIKLTSELDRELWDRYGDVQAEYEEHNAVEKITTAVVVYADTIPTGCGCFKKFDTDSIEIKRMFVVKKFRGSGFSTQILEALEKWGVELGYKYAVLETGVKQQEAIGLYKKFGYQQIANYPPYEEMSSSLCFRKKLGDKEKGRGWEKR